MWLDLLSPERITAIGGIITVLFSAWITSEVRKLKAKVADMEAQREKDQGVIKAALRHIRDRIVHSGILIGLLQLHAPGIAIPPEPALPDELKDEV